MAREQRNGYRTQAAILAACVFAHLALGWWLTQPPQRTAAPVEVALQVSFIPAESARGMTPPPSFPVAPRLVAGKQNVSQQSRRPTPSAPPDPLVTAEPSADATPAGADTIRLLDALENSLRHDREGTVSARRNPMERNTAVLPGRVEPFTPEAIELREQITPATVVAAIGGLFGGNYDPCPDTRSKIRDLLARNEPKGEQELHILIDRERRRCR